MSRQRQQNNKKEEVIDIKPLKENKVCFIIRGTAPYVSNKMTKTAQEEVLYGMEHPNEPKPKRQKKNFRLEFEEGKHITRGGYYGIPSDGIRQAMVDASRSLGIPMTLSKQSFMVVPEGFDRDDSKGLSLFVKGKPSSFKTRTSPPSANINFAARPRWEIGWEAKVIVQWNESRLSANTITTLLVHAGRYVGVGAGRPFSKDSGGCGWGTFEIIRTVSKEKR